MLDQSSLLFSNRESIGNFSVFPQKEVKRCHVLLPDMPHPSGAIAIQGRFYIYVKFFSTEEAAQRAAQRLSEKGNPVILTQVPKGLVLWVYEPEAKLAS